MVQGCCFLNISLLSGPYNSLGIVLFQSTICNKSEGCCNKLLQIGRLMGFPGGTSKELIWKCRRPKRYGFDPWVRTIPWRRARQPILIFLPGDGESHAHGRLVGYSPLHGVAMSGTQLKRLSMTYTMWFTATETQFWKLEVWKQDVRRAMISLKKWKRGLSHLFWYLPAITDILLSDRCITYISAFAFTWPSPLFLSMSLCPDLIFLQGHQSLNLVWPHLNLTSSIKTSFKVLTCWRVRTSYLLLFSC